MSLQNKVSNPRGGKKYSPHDLSHQLKFTSSVGMLLPVYFDLLSPGDKVRINTQMFSRLQNMTSPAFTRLTEHIDFFSVPVTQLWSLFEQFFHCVKDFNSSVSYLSPSTLNQMPLFSMGSLPLNDGDQSDAALNDDMFDADVRGVTRRLMDLMQYGLLGGPGFGSKYLNPLVACAYQKIYQDFYRLSTREEKDVKSYNIDRFTNGSITLRADIHKFFTLRYRPWKKDYFTNTEPTPLASADSVGMLGDLSQIPDWLTSSFVSVGGQTQAVEDDSMRTTVYGSNGEIENETNISTDVLRKMFSFEKLMKLTARAGKTVDLQQLAHFGVKFDKYLAGKVMYLGSQHGTIAVDSVVANTQSSDVNLGQLGGKAQGVLKGKTISHTCGAAGHEIIMAIYSCVPESDYSSVGLNRIHTYKRSEDFFHPEYDQLGMQPQFAYEGDMTQDDVSNATVLGWTERWRELKQKYDRISGGLLKNWSNWCTQRVVRNNQLKTFYINPNMLDSIMLVPYISNSDDNDAGVTFDPANPWKTDPLIHLLHFDSKKLSQMSVHTDKIGL